MVGELPKEAKLTLKTKKMKTVIKIENLIEGLEMGLLTKKQGVKAITSLYNEVIDTYTPDEYYYQACIELLFDAKAIVDII